MPEHPYIKMTSEKENQPDHVVIEMTSDDVEANRGPSPGQRARSRSAHVSSSTRAVTLASLDPDLLSNEAVSSASGSGSSDDEGGGGSKPPKGPNKHQVVPIGGNLESKEEPKSHLPEGVYERSLDLRSFPEFNTMGMSEKTLIVRDTDGLPLHALKKLIEAGRWCVPDQEIDLSKSSTRCKKAGFEQENWAEILTIAQLDQYVWKPKEGVKRTKSNWPAMEIVEEFSNRRVAHRMLKTTDKPWDFPAFRDLQKHIDTYGLKFEALLLAGFEEAEKRREEQGIPTREVIYLGDMLCGEDPTMGDILTVRILYYAKEFAEQEGVPITVMDSNHGLFFYKYFQFLKARFGGRFAEYLREHSSGVDVTDLEPDVKAAMYRVVKASIDAGKKKTGNGAVTRDTLIDALKRERKRDTLTLGNENLETVFQFVRSIPEYFLEEYEAQNLPKRLEALLSFLPIRNAVLYTIAKGDVRLLENPKSELSQLLWAEIRSCSSYSEDTRALLSEVIPKLSREDLAPLSSVLKEIDSHAVLSSRDGRQMNELASFINIKELAFLIESREDSSDLMQVIADTMEIESERNDKMAALEKFLDVKVQSVDVTYQRQERDLNNLIRKENTLVLLLEQFNKIVQLQLSSENGLADVSSKEGLAIIKGMLESIKNNKESSHDLVERLNRLIKSELWKEKIPGDLKTVFNKVLNLKMPSKEEVGLVKANIAGLEDAVSRLTGFVKWEGQFNEVARLETQRQEKLAAIKTMLVDIKCEACFDSSDGRQTEHLTLLRKEMAIPREKRTEFAGPRQILQHILLLEAQTVKKLALLQSILIERDNGACFDVGNRELMAELYALKRKGGVLVDVKNTLDEMLMAIQSILEHLTILFDDPDAYRPSALSISAQLLPRFSNRGVNPVESCRVEKGEKGKNKILTVEFFREGVPIAGREHYLVKNGIDTGKEALEAFYEEMNQFEESLKDDADVNVLDEWGRPTKHVAKRFTAMRDFIEGWFGSTKWITRVGLKGPYVRHAPAVGLEGETSDQAMVRHTFIPQAEIMINALAANLRGRQAKEVRRETREIRREASQLEDKVDIAETNGDMESAEGFRKDLEKATSLYEKLEKVLELQENLAEALQLINRREVTDNPVVHKNILLLMDALNKGVSFFKEQGLMIAKFTTNIPETHIGFLTPLAGEKYKFYVDILKRSGRLPEGFEPGDCPFDYEMADFGSETMGDPENDKDGNSILGLLFPFVAHVWFRNNRRVVYVDQETGETLLITESVRDLIRGHNSKKSPDGMCLDRKHKVGDPVIDDCYAETEPTLDPAQAVSALTTILANDNRGNANEMPEIFWPQLMKDLIEFGMREDADRDLNFRSSGIELLSIREAEGFSSVISLIRECSEKISKCFEGDASVSIYDCLKELIVSIIDRPSTPPSIGNRLRLALSYLPDPEKAERKAAEAYYARIILTQSGDLLSAQLAGYFIVLHTLGGTPLLRCEMATFFLGTEKKYPFGLAHELSSEDFQDNTLRDLVHLQKMTQAEKNEKMIPPSGLLIGARLTATIINSIIFYGQALFVIANLLDDNIIADAVPDIAQYYVFLGAIAFFVICFSLSEAKNKFPRRSHSCLNVLEKLYEGLLNFFTRPLLYIELSIFLPHLSDGFECSESVDVVTTSYSDFNETTLAALNANSSTSIFISPADEPGIYAGLLFGVIHTIFAVTVSLLYFRASVFLGLTVFHGVIARFEQNQNKIIRRVVRVWEFLERWLGNPLAVLVGVYSVLVFSGAMCSKAQAGLIALSAALFVNSFRTGAYPPGYLAASCSKLTRTSFRKKDESKKCCHLSPAKKKAVRIVYLSTATIFMIPLEFFSMGIAGACFMNANVDSDFAIYTFMETFLDNDENKIFLSAILGLQGLLVLSKIISFVEKNRGTDDMDKARRVYDLSKNLVDSYFSKKEEGAVVESSRQRKTLSTYTRRLFSNVNHPSSGFSRDLDSVI